MINTLGKMLLEAITHPFIVQTGVILLKIVCLLIAIAYYTIAERKIMAAIQRRRGPNVVGFWGLLQPFADALKLIAKEMVIPSHANSRIFVIAPILILTLGLVNWSILPFGCHDYSDTVPLHYFVAADLDVAKTLPGLATMLLPVVLPSLKRAKSSVLNAAPALPLFELFNTYTEANAISDVNYGVLVVLALSSLTVYGLIIAGWASNSKYAFLGALRSAAQMISYEVSISLILLPIIAMAGSLNFTKIVMAQETTIWFIVPLLPVSIIFFISMIAETNRTPFDLPEAEAELVAGYNVEYSSIIFAMFFLGEYGNMIMMSVLKALLFLGGWSFFSGISPAMALAVKALVFCFLFILVRATFPRYRYDQLMDIGWKVFLPVTTGYLLLVIGLLLAFDAHPVVHELRPICFDESGLTPFPTQALLPPAGGSN
jgi:NADH-quinone oxidoreductase subunit H